MINPDDVVSLSRLQFGATALFHFLFVPLTLGLSWILVIAESAYVMTGKVIYQDITRFWGKLFGINFVMGVTTGITMEFQFGTNWAYYSHYVGDIFGTPLAIEGLMAFFLESTLVGLFFFGWDKLSRGKHLLVTMLVALGSNLSALWILIGNGWMQNPVGAEFNLLTQRMELVDIAAVLFNPVAQVKFVHTVAAGYVAASMFVMGVSSWYLLRKTEVQFALRSFAIASGFGLAAILSVIVLGDESGYRTGEVQKVKLAAIEAEWETEPAPASFTLFGFPDQQGETTHAAIKIPYLMGIIATRSIDEAVTGLKDIKVQNEARIRSGMVAAEALDQIRQGADTPANRARFEQHGKDLGYGLLLTPYASNIAKAGEAEIAKAVDDSIPPVAPLVLGLSGDGGAWHHHAGADGGELCPALPQPAARLATVAQDPALEHSAALDCHRGGLAGGRARPSTLDHQRRAAGLGLGLFASAGPTLVQPHRHLFHLHPVAGGGAVPVAPCDQQGARHSPYRPLQR